MAEVKRASFAIEDMKEGSGLWDNARATIIGGKFTKEPPDNYQASGNPLFGVANFLLAGDAPEEERRQSQSYSLGATAGDNFTISEDGDYLIPVSDDSAARKDSKFGTFAASLQSNGVSKTIMADFAWSKVIGLDGHWNRKDDKERGFADDNQRTRNPKREGRKPQTLVLTKLYALPREKAAGKTNGAVASTPVATPAATEGDLDTVTTGHIEAVLAKAKDKRVQRAQLIMLLSRSAVADLRRQQIALRGADEEFIKGLADLGIVTYDPADKHQYVGLVPVPA